MKNSLKRELRSVPCFGLFLIIALTRLADGQIRPIDDSMQKINPRQPLPFAVDEERIKAVGIKQIQGEHCIIFTDVRDRLDIDELAVVFDLAVDPWCRFFSVDPDRTKHWKMRAYIMEDEARFRKAGLIPGDLPKFPAGYQLGRDMWVYVQPGSYYTRHLLLHEGTHAFMSWFLNGTGAPWFSEGMAEKLALNHWNSGKLELNFQVSDRDQVPYWGRVKLVRRDLSQGKGFALAEVLQFPASSFRDVKAYGWSWAACDFLARHPLSSKSFVEFNSHVDNSVQRFDLFVKEALKPHWDQLELDWELFVNELEYGTDIESVRLTSAESKESRPSQWEFKIDSRFGWQSSACAVTAGDQIRIEASGRCQVGSSEIDGKKTPWNSTPDGISLQHPNGKRIGLLLVGIIAPNAETPRDKITSLNHPLEVGVDLTFTAKQSGILALRINDSSANLHDNQGTLEVTISKVK